MSRRWIVGDVEKAHGIRRANPEVGEGRGPGTGAVLGGLPGRSSRAFGGLGAAPPARTAGNGTARGDTTTEIDAAFRKLKLPAATRKIVEGG